MKGLTMTSKEKNSKLIEFGSKILYQKSLPEGLPLIATYAKEIIEADRCSMFIYSPQKAELWTTLADGINRITIPSDKGIVGETLRVKSGMIENNVYLNDLFLADIDAISGYQTKNIITEPIFSTSGDIVGVFELLNKDNGFSEADAKYMKFFAKSLSNFIELINLYEG